MKTDTMNTDKTTALSLLAAEQESSDLLAQLEGCRAEVKWLREWKESMLSIEKEWDEQTLAKMLGGKLGASCRKVIAEGVPRLIAERDELLRKLALCRNAMDTLSLVVGLTAVKHASQLPPLQEAVDYARKTLVETAP